MLWRGRSHSLRPVTHARPLASNIQARYLAKYYPVFRNIGGLFGHIAQCFPRICKQGERLVIMSCRRMPGGPWLLPETRCYIKVRRGGFCAGSLIRDWGKQVLAVYNTGHAFCRPFCAHVHLMLVFFVCVCFDAVHQ